MANEVSILVTADTSKAKRELGSLQSQTAKGFGQVKKVAGAAMLGIGAAAVAGFGKALMAGASFERSMNRVEALTGANEQAMKSLSDQAKELGATTQFSASQAADAMGFLGQAGFKTQDILGAMPGTLSLAAAGQMDLARTADIASNVLTGFGKDASEMNSVADVLAKTFTSTNTDLTMLGESMKFVAPVAKSAGVSFEEAAAAIGLMGNAGIQGSMAGTSLRGAITRLLTPTGEAADTIERLGLNATDSSGQLMPLQSIIRQLEESGADTADMMTIFGQRAGPAMAALVDQGADALGDLTGELEESGGTAERIAETQMKGLSGAILTLKSRFEGLMIAIAEAGVLDVATRAVQGLATGIAILTEKLPAAIQAIKDFVRPWVEFGRDFIDKHGRQIREVFDRIVDFAGKETLLGGIAGVVALLGGALTAMGVAAAGAVAPFAAIVGAAVAVGAGIGLLVKHWDSLKQRFPILEDLEELAVQAFGAAKEAIQDAIEFIEDVAPDIWEAVKPHLETVKRVAGSTFDALEQAFGDAVEFVQTKAPEIWSAVKPHLETVKTQAGEAFGAIQTAASEAFGGLSDVLEEQDIPGQLSGIRDAITEVDLGEVLTNLAEAWGSLQSSIQPVIDILKPLVEDVIVALKDELQPIADTIREEFGPAWADLKPALSQALELMESLKPVMKAIGIAVGAILVVQLVAFLEILKRLIPIISEFIQSGIRQLSIAFQSAAQIIEGAMKIIQGIIETVLGVITGDWERTWDGLGLIVEGAFGIIGGVVEFGMGTARNIIDTGLGLIGTDWESVWGGIRDFTSGIWGSITGGVSSAIETITGIFDGGFAGLWETVTGIGGDIIGWHEDLGAKIETALSNVPGILLEIGREAMRGLWQGMGEIWTRAREWVTNTGTRIKNAIPNPLGMLVEVGKDIVRGLVNGIKSMASEPVNAMKDIGGGLVSGIGGVVGWGSPAKQFIVIGRDIMRGLQVGIEDEEEEVQNALTGFVTSMMDSIRHSTAVEEFGEFGGEVIHSLTRAMEEESESAGRNLSRAVDRLFEEAESRGKPISEDLGMRLMEALTIGLETGSPDAIAKAKDIIKKIGISMQEEVETVVQLTADTFADALDSVFADNALLDKIGSRGARIMDTLNDALEEGGERNIRALADIAADMSETLRDELPPAQASFLGTQFMDALNRVIKSGGEEGIDAFEDMLATINRILAGGAIDIRTGTEIIAEDIQGLADATGFAAEDIAQHIRKFIDAGLFDLTQALGTFTDDHREVVDQLIQAWKNGEVNLNEVISRIIAMINGIPPMDIEGADIGDQDGGESPTSSRPTRVAIPRDLKVAVGTAMATTGSRSRDEREAQQIANLWNSLAPDIRGAANVMDWLMRKSEFWAPFGYSLTSGNMLQKLAHGGTARGGMALVGERGPELVKLPAGSRVFSNRESQGMSGGITVNMPNATVYARDERDAERSAGDFAWGALQALRSRGL